MADGGTLIVDTPAGGSVTLAGQISGNGNVVVEGSGTAMLSGTTTNSYIGGTAVDSGTLEASLPASLPTSGGGYSGVSVSTGGTLAVAVAGTDPWRAAISPHSWAPRPSAGVAAGHRHHRGHLHLFRRHRRSAPGAWA